MPNVIFVLCVAMCFGIGQAFGKPLPVYPHLGHVLVPTVTPLTEHGEFDHLSFAKLVEFVAKRGVHGIYVGGSTGEGLHLDERIRNELIFSGVTTAKDHKISCVVHVGAALKAEAIRLAETARHARADAVSALPPFVGGASFEEVLEFYSDLVAAAHPLPVLAYYIPAVTGVEMSLDQLVQISEIPGIMGFKFTGYNLYKMNRLIRRLQPGQVVYNGQDQVLALGMQFGAHGGIGSAYNFVPERFVSVVNRYLEKDFQRSADEQVELNNLLELYKEGVGAAKQVATIKRILMFIGVIHSDRCAQRKSLTEREQKDLFDRLSQHSDIIPDNLPEGVKKEMKDTSVPLYRREENETREEL